ncbi:flavin reductase family protein [Candidatus Persebacteraceae bacterium Df01]|jgi:flavin reductase (DIM6/NTAB) family NADH-FMN oxidoreductase RutF|uniref:Flavin reductase family protein n=1 Tax=Candidatus Doriopsillibacter californiensis TaxID=2970740 RepID=A0ABT7QKW4_9GAMM|nr:flavin reductase family protein [Candidatus Persebacteraceae bacterium Df01]
MIIDMATQSRSSCYHWMTQAVIPRPIAWILTENNDCSYNLAPFSYFNALCSAPPLIGVSITAQKNEIAEKKDTLVNIRSRKNFVVHIASVAQLTELNDSAATLPYGKSEVAATNLAVTPYDNFVLPRLTDCPLALACELHKEIDLDGQGEQILILGKIRWLYASEATLTTDAKDRPLISAEAVNPVARLSAGNYAHLGGFITLHPSQ